MRIAQVLLISLLVLYGRPAYSGWVSLGGNESAGLTIYVDPSTMSRKGDQVTISILYDFKTPQSKEGDISFLSATMLREYDCAKEHTRLLTVTNYSGEMGNGQIVSNKNFDQPEWAPVGPLESGTIANDLWTLACR